MPSERFDAPLVRRWLAAASVEVTAQRDHLTALDAAIGDGDHGINLARGFEAVVAAIEGAPADSTPGALLILAGRTLVSTVGGASGPLWGQALRRAGRALGDTPTADGPQLVTALEAAFAGIAELGGASLGDKTMLDALDPAVRALNQQLAAGDSLAQALSAAAEAAAAGADATIPLVARKGRASYLGERSIGHLDPGAASTALILRALARSAAD